MHFTVFGVADQVLLHAFFRHCPTISRRQLQTGVVRSHKNCRFGLLLDIDGVICRGKDILPGVRDAFRMLTDSNGRFRVPTVFVTNASNTLRATKAERLCDLLGVNVLPEQVVMSHSPLKMFKQFQERHCLIIGQGPVRDIAAGLGFTKVSTCDDLTTTFPNLDMVDHSKRVQKESGFEQFFPPVEAVVLFGLPLTWECQLQIILDVLLTDGKPTENRVKTNRIPYPHIPILACNIDLLWMAEAALPRFAHGTFMVCLESLYKKLTGYDLKYTALLGKPSELTYHHAEFCIRQHAHEIGLLCPRTLYAVGDNPESDILGANLFQQYVRQRTLQKLDQLSKVAVQQQSVSAAVSASATAGHSSALHTHMQTRLLDPKHHHHHHSRTFEHHHIEDDEEVMQDHGVEQCYSVLVETGVYSKTFASMNGTVGLKHFESENQKTAVLKTPSFTEENLLSAVKMIVDREKFK